MKKYTIKYSDESSTKITDDYILSFMKNEIKNGLEERQAIKISNTAKNIMSNYISKDKMVIPGKKGLLVGQVQSGKTKTFLAAIASSFDHGYDAVLVLSGVDSVLMNQTSERLKDTFKSDEFSTLGKIEINEISSEQKVKEIRKYLESPLTIKQGIKYIFPVLKNKSWLERTINAFQNIDKKILIIDDEGDQASHDIENNKKANGEIDVASTINKNIRLVLDSTDSVSYLSVTATPYANLVLNAERELSPTFCVILEPGKNYKGLEYFHNGDYKGIIEIDEDIILNNDQIVNDLMQRAIPAFCVGNSFIRITNSKKTNKTFQMLVHVYRKIISNDEFKLKLENKINNLRKKLEMDKDSFDYIKYFINDFIKRGLSLNGLDWVLENSDLLNEVIQDVSDHLSALTIHHKNAKTKNDQTLNIGDEIIIGSNLIERGVTFDNLRVTYMGFVPKRIQGDTIIQRVRWFGYRDKSENHLVFMTKTLSNVYEQLNNAQIDLYDKISTKDGFEDVRENGFEFPFHPTRPTVNIEARYTELTQTINRQQWLEEEKSDWNLENSLIETFVKDNQSEMQKYFDWGHSFVRIGIKEFSSRYQELIKFINNKIFGKDVDLISILEKNNIDEIDVMFPRNNERKRTVYPPGRVDIFQGKSEGECIDDMLRPNDRFVLKKYCSKVDDTKPRAQIQLHNIKPFIDDVEIGKQYFYALIINNAERKKGIVK